MGASSKKATVGYRYFLGIHMVLCHGPIDKLVAIEVDEKLAWQGNITGGTININEPELFGGEEREGGIVGAVDIDMGRPNQRPNAYLQSQLGENIPAFRGVVSAVLNQVLIGLNPYLKRWVFWAQRIHVRQNGLPQWYDEAAAIGNDMNPAHILRECLTDPDWGMSYPETDIDDVSFMAAADQLKDEMMGISLLWDRSMVLEEFIQLILKHIDGSIYVDRGSGRFVLTLVRDNYQLSDLLVLNEDSIERITNFKRNTVGELVNSVTAVYWDGETGKQASITVQDIALAAQQQSTINTTIQFPGFTNGDIASRVASRTLRALSVPLASATIYANRTAAALNVGDVFLLDWPKYGITQSAMRVASVELGTLTNNIVKISCVEDVFSLSSAVYAAPSSSEWVDPNNPPAPCPFHDVKEATYWEIVQRVGELEAQSLSQDASYVVATGVEPSSDSANAKMYSNPTGTGYQETGTVDFCPSAIINQTLNYTDTIISLTAFVSDDLVEVGTYATIEDEIVEILAISRTQATIGRGCLDTIPAQHASGIRIYFSDAFYETDQIEYVDGETARVRILPTTARGTLPINDAPEQTVIMRGRLSRPYPPARLSLNGIYYNESIDADADLQISWRHRDRLQQTAALISSDQDSDIGPEQDTTYSLVIFNQDNDIIASASEIVANNHTFTIADLSDNYGTLRLELRSHRGDVESFQAHNFTFRRIGYGTQYGDSYGGT